ncbi:MAG: sigma factor [Streptosporangiaceae bacterium]
MAAQADAEFSEFMHGRWAALVRLGYGLTGDAGLAGDLAQTALARAYASWSRVRRNDDPDAYVRRIMLNANRSRFRKRRVAERLTDALPEAGAAAAAADVTASGSALSWWAGSTMSIHDEQELATGSAARSVPWRPRPLRSPRSSARAA